MTDIMTEASFSDREMLEAMTRLCEERLVPPSVREIQAAMHFKSPHSVSRRLDNLVNAGLVERLPGYRCYMPVAWRDRVRLALKSYDDHAAFLAKVSS